MRKRYLTFLIALLTSLQAMEENSTKKLCELIMKIKCANAATKKSLVEKVNTLIKEGGCVNAQHVGRFSLHYAACREVPVCITSSLLQAGARVDDRDTYGRTPLHIAALNGNLEVVKLLLVSGADKNAQDKEGDTPLHGAVAMGNKDTVRSLLQAGADSDRKNRDDKTPLHYAAVYKNMEIWCLLVSFNARTQIKHNSSKTSSCDDDEDWVAGIPNTIVLYWFMALARPPKANL